MPPDPRPVRLGLAVKYCCSKNGDKGRDPPRAVRTLPSNPRPVRLGLAVEYCCSKNGDEDRTPPNALTLAA